MQYIIFFKIGRTLDLFCYPGNSFYIFKPMLSSLTQNSFGIHSPNFAKVVILVHTRKLSLDGPERKLLTTNVHTTNFSSIV